MTPIYQAQSWKFIRTNKQKNTKERFDSFNISPHKEKHNSTTLLQFAEEPRRLTAIYIFRALSLAAVSIKLLAHLQLAQWSLHYISYKHSRFVSPEYYPRTAL